MNEDIQTIQAVKVDLDEITERAREAINNDLEDYIGRQWVSPEEVLALVRIARAAVSWKEFADRNPYGARGDDDLEEAVEALLK